MESHRRITVIAPFTDTAGVRHEVGATGVLMSTDCDLIAMTAVLHVGLDDGTTMDIPVDLRAKDAPGNGTMSRFFEVGDYEMAVCERQRRREEWLKPLELPELPPMPKTAALDKWDENHYRQLMDRAIALAARREFGQAEEMMLKVSNLPYAHSHQSVSIASDLESYARPYARPAEADIFEWIYGQAISYWYSWAGGATIGGEGAAFMMQVNDATARREDLRRRIKEQR